MRRLTFLPLSLALSLILLAAPSAAQAVDELEGLKFGPWHLVGPIANPSGNDPADESAVDELIDEIELDEPWIGLAETYTCMDGGERGFETLPEAADAESAIDSGRLNLQALCAGRGGTDRAAAFLYLAIRSPDARVVTVDVGSDDGLRLWLNGERLVHSAAGRAVNPSDHRVKLRLEPGHNHLLAKVTNGGGAFGFELRLPRQVSQVQIDQAIDKGLEALIRKQLIDGTWAAHAGGYPNGQTALSVYTLIKCGVPVDHPAVLKALATLRVDPTAKTYSVGCLLMALEATGKPEYRDWMEELVGDLLTWQDSAGGWAYPEGHPDLSITQYAVLGLRSAHKAGIEVPKKVWLKAFAFTMDHRGREVRGASGEYEAGFSYRVDGGATGSMTTAGLSNLAIIRDILGDDLPPRDRKQLATAIEQGSNWLGARWSTQNPGKTNWHRYYLYGVERAGALLPTESFGGRAWYPDGATALVESQNDNGLWTANASSAAVTDTCFALLFLKRATRRAVTEFANTEVDDKGWLNKSDLAAGPVELHVVNRVPAVFSVRSVDGELPEDLRAARFSVRRGNSGDWLLVAETDQQPFATRYSFPLPGLWQVKAEVELLDGLTLDSGIVDVEVEVGITPEQLAYATDRIRDLLPVRRPKWEASTSSNATRPENLSDGLVRTAWACARDDKEPEVTVSFRSAKVDRILFTHRLNENGQGPFPRPRVLEVWMDKDKLPVLVDVNPDPREKTVLELPEQRKLRKLRVRILEVEGGTLGAANFGFASIELHGPRR